MDHTEVTLVALSHNKIVNRYAGSHVQHVEFIIHKVDTICKLFLDRGTIHLKQ